MSEETCNKAELTAINGWKLDASLAPVTPCHWLSFEAPPSWLFLTLGAVSVVLAIIGIFGNVGVIALILSRRTLRNKTNYLTLSLSCADLLMLMKLPFAALNNFAMYPVLGSVGCMLYGASSVISGLASIWSITAISCERCLTAVSGLDVTRRFSSKQIKGLVMTIWLCSFLFCLPPFIGYNAYVLEGMLTTCTIDVLSSLLGHRIYMWAMMILAYFLPTIIIIGCHVRIALFNRNNNRSLFSRMGRSMMRKPKGKRRRVVADAETAAGPVDTEQLAMLEEEPDAIVVLAEMHGRIAFIDEDEEEEETSKEQVEHRKQTAAANPSSDLTRSPSPTSPLPVSFPLSLFQTPTTTRRQRCLDSFVVRRLQTEKKLIKLCALLMTLWILAWTPYLLVFLVSLTEYRVHICPVCDTIPALACKLSAVVNPYVYALSLPRFRREIRKVARKWTKNSH